jgi:DNA-binding beta-propeller fold protein YncE
LKAQQERPTLIDNYLDGANTFSDIATKFDQVRSPTDLDFHHDFSKKELWVVNKETENTGGSTITISNLGESNQKIEYKKDQNSWHFMSLPTGIAFGTDGMFATSPGVYDANHDGGQPFTGPSLWSSHPDIYAQPSGGNGSHMDMLHESPQCQGIAHEKDNVYWVFDGYNGDIVRYDFVDDHGPGNDYHADGIIYRYSEEPLKKDPFNKVVSHLDLDKATGWLYAVDNGNQRVIRLDINTGQAGGMPSFGPFEPLAEYKHMTGYTWEEVITTGLTEPAGIAVLEDRLLVSDYATGEILVYDISGMPATKLGSIETEAEGIMGITIGPDGYIYYVDFDGKTVTQITPAITGIASKRPAQSISLAPNPSANGVLHIKNASANSHIQVFDLAGRLAFSGKVHDAAIHTGIEEKGMYLVEVTGKAGNKAVLKWLID